MLQRQYPGEGGRGTNGIVEPVVVDGVQETSLPTTFPFLCFSTVFLNLPQHSPRQSTLPPGSPSCQYNSRSTPAMRPTLALALRPAALPAPFYVNPATVHSTTVSGYQHFTQPCRRIEFEYHQNDIRGEGLRCVLLHPLFLPGLPRLASDGGLTRLSCPFFALPVDDGHNRDYLRTSATALARENPQTEVIVRTIRGVSAPVARAYYSAFPPSSFASFFIAEPACWWVR